MPDHASGKHSAGAKAAAARDDEALQDFLGGLMVGARQSPKPPKQAKPTRPPRSRRRPAKAVVEKEVVKEVIIIDATPIDVRKAVPRHSSTSNTYLNQPKQYESEVHNMSGSSEATQPMFLRVMYAIGALLLATGSLVYVMTDTPPNRAKNEALWLQKGIEEEKTKQIEAGGGANRAPAPPPSGYFVGGASMATYISTPGLPFTVNGATPGKPAAKVLLSSVPKGVTGSYRLVLDEDPSVTAWSSSWSANPSPDVNAFLRRYSAESPKWVLVYANGPVTFDM